MGIMTRFTRLCKADMHGVIDQLEDKGLLLRQVFRDMEEELDRKESRLKQMRASRDQAQREFEKYTQECEKLENDLEVAIEKDKDAIARSLIKKLKPLMCHRDELERHVKTLNQEITHFRECVDEQRLQYEQLQLRSTEYFHKTKREEWEKAVSGITGHDASREPSDEEIDLELLQRKEASKGGAQR